MLEIIGKQSFTWKNNINYRDYNSMLVPVYIPSVAR